MASQTVLITGCATGIGRATATTFAEAGWEVYATDSDPDAIADLAEKGCVTAQLDVTTDGDAEAVVERIYTEHNRLDCLYNNTGYGQIGPLEEIPVEEFKRQLDVNLVGQHRLIRAALPVMRDQPGGTIVNMASVYGRTIFPGQGAYASSKWGVTALTETLRVEVAEYDIDVVVIEPGPVDTEFGATALSTKEHLEPVDAYEWFYRLYDENRYDRRFLDRGIGYVHPTRVADVVFTAAESDDPQRRYVVGPWKWFLRLGYITPRWLRDRLYHLLKTYL